MQRAIHRQKLANTILRRVQQRVLRILIVCHTHNSGGGRGIFLRGSFAQKISVLIQLLPLFLGKLLRLLIENSDALIHRWLLLIRKQRGCRFAEICNLLLCVELQCAV